MINTKKTTKRGICGICPAGCWVKVTLENGKMVKVVADDESSNGMICKIGEHSPEIVYSENRLKYPLKRKGKKGNFEFERISWDEAYDTIVEKLQEHKHKHGAESTAIYTGRGSFELSLCDIFQPKGVAISSASSVLFPFGSPNTLGVGALCYVSFAMIAPDVTMGGMYFNMYSDIENAEMVVIWGANPATDSPPIDYYRILKAHEKGAKIVVIDPRKTSLAKLPGAEWVPIKPGTDGALALGLCNILIREDLYDFNFVENWTVGFEEFKTYAQQFRPEMVAEITGVAPEMVKKLARAMVENKGVAPVMYTGLEYTNSGVQNIRATFVLWALSGNLDVPGGKCFTSKKNMFPINRDGLLENPDMNKALGRDRFPVYSKYRGESHAISLPESVLHGKPYKIRSLIIHGASILTSWPQTQIWEKTLNELDFVVSIDRQLTADCAYADIVLPATTMYEINSYMTYANIFRIREKMIEPIGEARNDFFIMVELAKRLGYGHLYPQTEKEVLDYILKGSGFSSEEVKQKGGKVEIPRKMNEFKKWEKGLLRNDGKPGFETPSGKFEIASSILFDYGYDALPIFQEPTEGPESSPEKLIEYPLVFNSGARVDTDFRSQHHGIKGLLKERPEPTVMMNTTDATERNITHGDKVIIKTERGKVAMRAIVSENIIKGAVDANMGGGGPVGPSEWKEANINYLTDLNNYDPISGFPVYKSLLCEIKKVIDSNSVKIGTGEIASLPGTTKKKQLEIKKVYLDHNATTPLHKDVKEVIIEYLDKYCNPSSVYKEAQQNKQSIEGARRSIANLINAKARSIIITSGGSESNNTAIKGVIENHKGKKVHVITTQTEHPSVIKTCEILEKKGVDVSYLPVDAEGLVDIVTFKKAIQKNTIIASVMLANNETGVIQPIKELCRIAHENNIIFHTDAVQALGKIPIDVEDLGVDLLSSSAHKLYGMKGIGMLYVKEGIKIQSLISGGGQENKMRAGTENIPAIMGMGKAFELAQESIIQMKKVSVLRDELQSGIIKLFPEAIVNGNKRNRLPNTLNITLPGIRGESFVLALSKRGIYFSSASACKSGSPEPSHVLTAMGINEENAHCTVRFSLGLTTQESDIEYTLMVVDETLKQLKNNIRFVACR